MALRLRRGTDAERQLITPVQGELIYTTDTKLLYVGDGSTAGGTLVTGAGGGSTTLDALTDTDLTGAVNNDVLTFNAGTNKWEAVAVPGVGILSLNDLSDVFLPNSPEVGSILRFDGLNFTAAPITEIFQEQQNYKINIVGDDSTILVDTDTNTFTGIFVGDVVGNVVGNVAGDVTGSIFGDNSKLLVDGVSSLIPAEVVQGTFSGNVIGDVIGNVIGDVIGSVFTDSSQLVIDGQFGDIYPREIKTNTFLKIVSDTPNQIGFVQMETQDEFTALSLIRRSDSDLTGLNDRYGQLRFGREDANGLLLTTIMSANEDFVWIFNGSDGVISEAKVLTNANGDIGVGTTTPAEKLDVRGNTVVSGFVQFGSLTTTERTALTAANGMVIYNSTDNRFQGYQNGAWINLDDGTAA